MTRCFCGLTVGAKPGGVKTHQSKLMTRNSHVCRNWGPSPGCICGRSEFQPLSQPDSKIWYFPMTDNHDCCMRKVIHRSILYYLDRLTHAINKIQKKKKCYANLSQLGARKSVHFTPFEYMFPFAYFFLQNSLTLQYHRKLGSESSR